MHVKVKRLTPNACLPAYNDSADAGADLRAAADVLVAPSAWAMVPTGIAVLLPQPRTLGVVIDGIARSIRQVPEVQIRPRSGLAARHGIMVLNSPGTIDCNYIDEWRVLLFNAGSEPFQVKAGDRIAQAIFTWVEQVEPELVDGFDTSRSRGGGFGSSGRA